MKTTTLFTTIGLALGASLFGIDTSAAPGDPPPISPCGSPPLASDCGNPDYRKQCPASDAVCDPMNKRNAALEARPKAGVNQVPNKLFGTPQEPAFADSTHTTNYGILATPYSQTPYRTPKKWGVGKKATRVRAIAPNTPNRWAAQEMKAKVAALSWTPNGFLSMFQRLHDSAAGLVGSCEDYVYKGFIDDERWLDAIYGCKGDTRCEVNVTLLPVTPGIARRTLNNPLAPTFQEFIPDYDGRMDFSGLMPKNACYAGTGAFLTDSLVAAFGADPAKKQSVLALIDVIRNQLSTYDIGHGSKGYQIGAKSQGFADEWDFHEVMNQRTAAITQGEFDEYKRRNDLMLAAMDHFWTVAKCVAHMNPTDCKGVPNAVGHVSPGEEQIVDGDPFALRAVFGNVDRTNSTDMLGFVNAHAGMLDALRAGAHIGSGLAFPGLGNRGAVALGASFKQLGLTPTQNVMSAQLHPNATTPGRSVFSRDATRLKLQQSPSVDNSYLMYLNLNWQKFPPKIDTSRAAPRLLCAPRATGRAATPATLWTVSVPAATENFVGELAACETVNVILDEWAKRNAHTQGPTCFDAANAACDWSPDMFVKRWVTNTVGYEMAAKERAYSECRDWRSTLFASGPLADPGAVHTAIGTKDQNRHRDLWGLPVKQHDNFGQDKKNNETWGNKAFGVGYEYDLGWEAKIFHRFTSAEATAAKDPNLVNVPCRMGGRTHVSFDAFAYAFGLPPFDIVSANFALEVDDDDNRNETGNVVAYGKGEFLETYQFYEVPKTTLPLNQAKVLYSKEDGDSETIAVIPVQITWVTLTFTIGLAWGYGAEVVVQTRTPNQGECTTNTLFELTAAVKPDAHLDLVVGADCSVAGIAGVGVDVDLVLLDIGLPIHGGTRLTASQDAKLFLGFDAGLDMTLGTLDGHMDAYAKFLGIKLFDVEIFHWSGFHTTIPLFAFKTRQFPLLELGAAAVDPPPLPLAN